MGIPSIDGPPPGIRVSIWQHGATAALILGFIAAGWLRLNDCDLFNPDSPRYLIYAQSLAETGQYRAIDTPGAPLYTWRPPGLPILLAPVLTFLPYDVVAAKLVVLLTAALLLLTVHAVASTTRGGWSGPLMVPVVGTSPLFLSLSTEVLTEVPYALGILAALYWIGRWDQSIRLPSRLSEEFPGVPHDAERPDFTTRTVVPHCSGPEDQSLPGVRASRWAFYLGAMIALAFTPIIRTIGVALVAAVGLWSLTARRRWKFLPAVVVAVSALGWLAWRSRSAAPGSNYAGSLLQNIREHGLPSVLAEATKNLTFYASAFPGVILPGLTSEQAFYAPMIIGPLPSLAAFGTPVALLAALIALTGILGLWQQRSQSGSAALVYLPLYIGCLAIWPWRHERFLWPLVPLLWAFVPSGCHLIGRFLPQGLRLAAQPAIAFGLIALSAWQILGDVSLISTNQRFLANRDDFYRTEAPGFYFSDWRQAGRWIHENTPAHSRLLTWQAAVGGTAHRFQRRVQFESLNPEKVRQQIAGFPARYLVVTTSQFGLGFGWQQSFADPSYSLTTVYKDRDVAVLEVGPNRTGVVSRTGYNDWMRSQQSALDEVLARFPERTDLLARKADLLQEDGQNQPAIAMLEDLCRRGMVTVRVCSSLGWLYMSERKYELAAHYLDLASVLPNAESVAQSLAEGAQLARERLNQTAEESLDQTIDRSLRRIRNLVASLNLAAAERDVENLLRQSPDHPGANYWRGYLHHLFGEWDLAESAYSRAVQAGSGEAREKLLILRLAGALESSSASAINIDGASEPVDPNSFAAHVRLARLYDEQGWSGRSLAVLESARMRFGDKPEILSPLAELLLKFARPEEAAPLFRRIQQDWPHEKLVRQGLATAEGALREPRFQP